MLRLIVAASLIALTFSTAHAARRVALVIGNDSYTQIVSLEKARNDAEAIASTLQNLGYEVLLAKDVPRREMNRQIQLFSSRLKPGDEALFYFAGHGVEISGRNYLLPTDIPEGRPGEEGFVTSEAVPVDIILDRIRSRGTKISILILDACRNNPFPKAGTRSLGGSTGLARSAAPEGTFILYSAGVGQEALDRLDEDDPNPNSVFTRNLIPLLSTPGLSLIETARQVRRKVQRVAATVSHDQRPAYYDEVIGDFFFSGRGSNAIDPANSTTKNNDRTASLERQLQELRKQLDEAETKSSNSQAVRDRGNTDGEEPHSTKSPRQQVATEMYKTGLAAYDRKDYEGAIEKWKVAGHLGNISAQHRLGWVYSRGIGVERDDTEAAMWYRKAADQGAVGSQVNYANMLSEGINGKKDPAEAAKYYLKAIDIPFASHALAKMYSEGDGVEKSPERSYEMFKKAARDMVRIIKDGSDWWVDRALQESWRPETVRELQRALAEEGWYKGKIDGHHSDETKVAIRALGAKWTKHSGNETSGSKSPGSNGEETAQSLYAAGLDAMREKNYGAAAKKFRRAANLGHSKAQNRLGLLYRWGRGVETNHEEAAIWFQKAADRQYAPAQYNLGTMYAFGRGVKRNDQTAAELFRKAAEQGHSSAQFNLGRMYDTGRGLTKSPKEAVRWYRKAADQNDAPALHNLGTKYKNGAGGLEIDQVKAAQLIAKAISLGNQFSIDQLRDNQSDYPPDFRRELQKILKSAGVYDGPIDGNLGPDTQAAIKAYSGSS